MPPCGNQMPTHPIRSGAKNAHTHTHTHTLTHSLTHSPTQMSDIQYSVQAWILIDSSAPRLIILCGLILLCVCVIRNTQTELSPNWFSALFLPVYGAQS